MSESAAERVAKEMNESAMLAMKKDEFDKARFLMAVGVLASLIVVQEERIKELEQQAEYAEQVRESRE